jgi:general secretion pathway protein A
VLRRLDDALGTREPFLILTGDPGTGKTAIVHEAVARWGPRVTAAFVAYSALSGPEFLEEIVRRFGAEPADGASRSKLVACVERSLADISGRGQVAILVVDDAHNLSTELLEELRLLVNAAQQARLPLEVLLVGLPALEARLHQPAIAALRQRVSIHAKLEPLSPSETRRYLHHRVTAAGGDGPTLFSRKTCREIAARTSGVPRQINALATEALRIAQVWGDQTVGVEHVQTAAASLGGFAPTGAAEDPEDADSQPATAPSISTPLAATPTPVIPAPPPAPEPAKPAVVAATAALATSSLVQEPPVVPVASAPPAPATPPTPPATPPTPPATHDAREWVARFIGDQGPVRLSSRVIAETTWEPEPFVGHEAESMALGAESPLPLERADRTLSHWRSRSRSTAQMAVTAVLGVILVASAIALVIRGATLARNRAGQTAGAATSATSSQASDKTSSSDKASSQAASRAGAGVAPPPAVEERRGDNSGTESRGPFTLDVGGYRDFDRALAERDRLSRLTGFEGWVISAGDGEDRPYRVVLGVYRNRQRAIDAADMLINSRTLHYAAVVQMPPRSARR